MNPEKLVVSQLELIRDRDLNSAKALIERAMMYGETIAIVNKIRGRRWRKVDKVRLVIGKHYIIRLVSGRRKYSPVSCRWTVDGWKGNSILPACRNSDLEVWCK